MVPQHTVFFGLLDALDYKQHHPIYGKICGKIITQAAPDYKPHLPGVITCRLSSSNQRRIIVLIQTL